MSTENIFLIANSNTLNLMGLRNPENTGFVNTATVAATLQDTKGNDVAGQVWPATLDYVADSDGCYRLLLSDELALVNKKQYRVLMVAQGDGLTARWDTLIPAKIRS